MHDHSLEISMRRVFLILLFVVMLVAPIFKSSLSGPAMAQSSTSDPNIPGWNLIFDDEFNETSLDKSHYQEYWGPISASWFNGTNSLILQDGLLRLKIDKQDVYQNGTTYHYTSGGFTQQTSQSYGRWVVRARFPQGKGTQAYISLWRKDMSWPPEIDFAEVRGILPTENVFSEHYSQGGQVLWNGFKLENIDFTNQFHEYTVDWQPGTVTWYVDGVQNYSTTQNFDTFPMMLAAGTLVGNCGDFADCPNGSNPFPTYLDIDYVRIYQKN